MTRSRRHSARQRRRSRLTWKTSWLRFSRPTPSPARAVPRPVDRRGRHPHRPATPKIIFDYMHARTIPTPRTSVHEDDGGHQPAPSCTPQHSPTSLVDMVSESCTKIVVEPRCRTCTSPATRSTMIGNGVSINRMYSRDPQPRDHLRRLHLRAIIRMLKGAPAVLQPRQHLPHRGRRRPRTSTTTCWPSAFPSAPSPMPSISWPTNVFSDRRRPPSTPSWRSTSRCSRAFMHLDTVFTQIDYGQVHHPSRHHGPADRLRDHP